MFRPIDTLAFDTDWPVMNGKVSGLRDARIIVLAPPTNGESLCNVVLTSVSANSLTFALQARRSSSTVYQATAVTVSKDSSNSTGKSYRATGTNLLVDITTDGKDFSIVSGSIPLQIVPCCVIHAFALGTAFSDSTLPVPGSGWGRNIDYLSRRVTYYSWVDTQSASQRPDVVRLRLMNGLSSPDLVIRADGEGVAETDKDNGVITLKPAMRDLDDNGRQL